MANIGRGAYEPPGDDVHIFDASEDDDDVEGSRLPLLIVIALFVLAAFAGVVWLAYTQGLQRGRTDAPRIIAAQKGPAKVAAEGETGSTQFKGLKIYQQPAPADPEADSMPPENRQASAEPPAVSPETTLIKPPAAAIQSPEAPKPAPESPPVLKPSMQAGPAEEAAPPSQESRPAPAAATPAAAGGYVLQIGAFKSQAEADAAWSTYRAKHAATLSGFARSVKVVDLGAKGTWYRLRVGSFADKNAAAALCAKLSAEGGACFPSK